MGIHRNPWGASESIGISGNPWESIGIHKKTIQSIVIHKNPWESKEITKIHGNPQESMEVHRNLLESIEIH